MLLSSEPADLFLSSPPCLIITILLYTRVARIIMRFGGMEVMSKRILISLIVALIIILTATTQAIRPTIRGDPAACAWYTDTSIANPYDESHFGWPGGPPMRYLNVYDTLDVFARNQDHKLLHYHIIPLDSGQLDGYVETVLPDIVTCYSSPAVVQTGPNTIHVFVWSAEEIAHPPGARNIYHWFLWHLIWDGNQWSRARIEGPSQFSNTNLSPEQTESANLVLRPEDATGIYTLGYFLGVEDARKVSASSWGDDRIDLFVLGPFITGSVNWHLTLISGQPRGVWEDIGTPHSLTLGIAAGSWGPGRIDVFALCIDDRAYYHKSFVEGALLSDNGRSRVNGWDQDWTLVVTQNVCFTSGPYVNQVPLFPGGASFRGLGFGGRGAEIIRNTWLDIESEIWGRGYHPDGSMSDLQPLGRSSIIGRNLASMSKPASVNYIGDHVTLFVRWTDDTLYILDYDLYCCQRDDYARLWEPVPDLPERAPTMSRSGRVTMEGQTSIMLMVDNINLPGSDYRNISLKTADPKMCAQACIEDPACMACTYVKPGYQGLDANCWLKNAVPNQVHDECCQSGVKGAEAFLTGDQISEASRQPQIASPQTESISKEGDSPGSDYGNLAETVLATALVPGTNFAAPSQAVSMTNNTDLPGGDLKDGFDLAAPDPALCAQACSEEPQCVAFVYVKPGTQGPNARCWLKNGIPTPIKDECCISGVIEGR
jgi:hypothetical protein